MKVPDQLKHLIESAILSGNRLGAIKLLKDSVGLHLADAKDAIDSLERELRKANPERYRDTDTHTIHDDRIRTEADLRAACLFIPGWSVVAFELIPMGWIEQLESQHSLVKIVMYQFDLEVSVRNPDDEVWQALDWSPEWGLGRKSDIEKLRNFLQFAGSTRG